LPLLNCSPQGCTIPGRQVAQSTKVCTVALNICGSSALTLLHVTLPATTFLKRLLDFWKSWDPGSP
jgi:hypothetical protein